MKKQLFFDDNKLFGRDNLTRKYGEVTSVAEYNDGVCSTDFCTSWVFRINDGKYRMLYFGHSKNFEGKILFCAESADGINFTPEKLWENPEKDDKLYSHEIMRISAGSEVAFIYEDTHSPDNKKYKLLLARGVHEELWVYDEIYTSSDLINWQLKENIYWGDGAEPLASVFYNEHRQCHTVCARKFWGIRSAGYKETTDWKNFSEYNTCLNVDSIDGCLDEIYGMYAFSYDGLYIGMPLMYRGLKSELNAKYKNGIIDVQLAYSYDGRYWQRSLREPFITGTGNGYPLTWVSSVVKREDGKINIYGSASGLEHGPAFSEPGTGKIFIYEMREDGFVALKTENKDEISVVATREKVWHGGEVHVNIKTQNATMAVYVTEDDEEVLGLNVLGIATPIDGYGHGDCVPFCGDTTDWVPEYKNGKKIDDLKGKTLIFEIKFSDGEIFSLAGDFTDVYNTEGARYRKFGSLPR